MSLSTRLNALITAIGTDIKAITAAQGNLSALSTTAKTSLVAALNELAAELANATEIADASTSTTATWSSTRIVQEVEALKSLIFGGTPGSAYDTLVEIATALEGDDTAIAGLLTAVGNRIAYDQAQTLTTLQQAQACANIGVGDPEVDLAAAYATAKL